MEIIMETPKSPLVGPLRHAWQPDFRPKAVEETPQTSKVARRLPAAGIKCPPWNQPRQECCEIAVLFHVVAWTVVSNGLVKLREHKVGSHTPLGASSDRWALQWRLQLNLECSSTRGLEPCQLTIMARPAPHSLHQQTNQKARSPNCPCTRSLQRIGQSASVSCYRIATPLDTSGV